MKRVVIIHESQVPETHPANHMGISLPESGWRVIHLTDEEELVGLWDLTKVMLQYTTVTDDEGGEYLVFDPDASVERTYQAFQHVQGGGDPAIVVCSINQFKQLLVCDKYLEYYPPQEEEV